MKPAKPFDREILRLQVSVTNAPRNERGALMAEYGLLLLMVAVAAIAVLLLLGGEVLELFGTTEGEFDDSRRNGPPPPD